jgi:hypothetical protein
MIRLDRRTLCGKGIALLATIGGKFYSLSGKLVGVQLITNSSPLPGAVQGSPYTLKFMASGGTPLYTWSLVSSTGTNTWSMSLAGTLSGTPTSAEEDTVTVQVTDSNGTVTSSPFILVVAAASPGVVIGLKASRLAAGSAATTQVSFGVPLLQGQLPSTPHRNVPVTFSRAITTADTSVPLAANWGAESGMWRVTFSNGQMREVALVNNQTSAAWVTALTTSATASATGFFPQVVDTSKIALWRGDAEVPCYVQPLLGTYPDGSIISLLVQAVIPTTLSQYQSDATPWSLRIGVAPTQSRLGAVATQPCTQAGGGGLDGCFVPSSSQLLGGPLAALLGRLAPFGQLKATPTADYNRVEQNFISPTLDWWWETLHATCTGAEANDYNSLIAAIGTFEHYASHYEQPTNRLLLGMRGGPVKNLDRGLRQACVYARFMWQPGNMHPSYYDQYDGIHPTGRQRYAENVEHHCIAYWLTGSDLYRRTVLAMAYSGTPNAPNSADGRDMARYMALELFAHMVGDQSPTRCGVGGSPGHLTDVFMFLWTSLQGDPGSNPTMAQYSDGHWWTAGYVGLTYNAQQAFMHPAFVCRYMYMYTMFRGNNPPRVAPYNKTDDQILTAISKCAQFLHLNTFDQVKSGTPLRSTGANNNYNFTFTDNGGLGPKAGSYSGTLSTPWPFPSEVRDVRFSNGQRIPIGFTNGSTTANWMQALTSQCAGGFVYAYHAHNYLSDLNSTTTYMDQGNNYVGILCDVNVAAGGVIAAGATSALLDAPNGWIGPTVLGQSAPDPHIANTLTGTFQKLSPVQYMTRVVPPTTPPSSTPHDADANKVSCLNVTYGSRTVDWTGSTAPTVATSSPIRISGSEVPRGPQQVDCVEQNFPYIAGFIKGTVDWGDVDESYTWLANWAPNNVGGTDRQALDAMQYRSYIDYKLKEFNELCFGFHWIASERTLRGS